MPSKLTIVLPIFNEAASLPHFLPELMGTSETHCWNLILVDDGSTDDSAQILSNYVDKSFVNIIHHKVNRGYGGALKTGIAAALTSHVITMDADGQHSITDVSRVYEFALKTDADMVVGSRTDMSQSGTFRAVGRWLIWNFARILVPLPIRDLNSGFKIYRTELAQEYLTLCPNSMAFSDVITLVFISQRNLVLECPIEVRKRSAGKSTIGFQTAFETIIEILNLVMLFNPLRVFVPLAVLFILVGVGWGLPLVLLGRGVSVGAMLAIVLGSIFFILGLIAGQLSAIRVSLLDFDHRKGHSFDADHDAQE